MRTFYAFAMTVIAIIFLVWLVLPASAAERAIPALSLLDAVRPYLVEIGSVLILAFVTWLSSWLRATFKVSMDEAHRAALHSALENGARLAVEKLDAAISGKTIPVGYPLIATGVEYVLTYSPDAVAHFGLTPERVADMIRAKLVKAA